MTLPRRTSLAFGMKFLNSKSAWLLANLEEGAAVLIADGTVIPVLGKEYTVRRKDGRGFPRLNPETAELTMHCKPEFVGRRVKDFLKALLCEECMRVGKTLAASLGKKITRITASKAHSRWGSCSTGGTLSFNQLLVHAPKAILDYVIAHEVAHLKEMNHGPKFWRIVETLHPDMLQARKWLKQHGHELHRYG